MKLISCTIENFGKLNNVTYDFSGECNTICEDNGWGKSTLASFIRVMFYGFKNEFLLVRKDTNVECDDFSCDIGEELFKIDAQSFERTVFIGQSDCVTATTDSINAKIGNLADNTDARMETLTEIFAADKSKKEWLGFNRIFESNLRKTGEW